MSVSLYRKYRPQNFAGLVGQVSAASVLTKSILRGKVGHAYLFSGPRGCGKTSAARIFAKALNCLSRNNFEPCGKCRNCTEITAGESLDVIEIDGASNNGVDNIRSLKENVNLAPFNSRYKIYIIDEVHMLSQGAFNALLKTLEEPPEHVIFIMATTEPHKVPVTIRSRCQHIPFRSITPDDIFRRLKFVCQQENISFDDDGLMEISRQADGALRDALSLLEQVSASGDVTLENTSAILGTGSRTAFERWIVAFRTDRGKAFADLRNILDGAGAVRVFEEIFALLRDIMFAATWRNVDGLGLSAPERMFVAQEAKFWEVRDIHRLMRATLRIITQARLGVRKDILLGMLMLEAENYDVPAEKVSSRRTLMSGTNSATSANTATTPALKSDLLRIAHQHNFFLWCAMFDAVPSVTANDLVLNIAHKYTFHILKNSRIFMRLSQVFIGYDNIILTHRDTQYICPHFTPSSTQTATPSATATPSTTVTSSATATPSATATSSATQKPSSFWDIIRELAAYGLKPELLQRIHSDTLDNDNDLTEDNDNDA